MSTDTIGDLWVGVWSLRYVFLFVAFMTATAFALEYRRKWHDAAGLVGVMTDELRLADEYSIDLLRRLKTTNEHLAEAGEWLAAAVADDDTVFSESYVYDRIPAWVPADVPGAERGQR